MKDEIMDELRRVREEMLEECGNDMKVFFQRLKEAEHLIPESLRVTPEEFRGRNASLEEKETAVR